MHIAALTVCVDYSDHLERSLGFWNNGADDLVVATAPRDTATIELCRRFGVKTHQTDVFYEHGAAFNKGAAIAEAYNLLNRQDWILLFDADIKPPEDWRTRIEAVSLEPGQLYGANRYYENGRPVGDQDVAGFFLLAHNSDPRMSANPIVQTCWQHAGNYDSELLERWPPHLRTRLDLPLIHFGQPWQNWFGRGRHKDMDAMNAERRKRGGTWQHERVTG